MGRTGMGFAMLERSLSDALVLADLGFYNLDFDEKKEVVQNLLQIQVDVKVFLDNVLEANSELENAEYSVVTREYR